MSFFGRVLGIDYGEKRIGLAITDPDRTMVFPREMLKVASEKEALEVLQKYCSANQISLIVLGVPYLLSMKKTAFSEKILNFGNELSKATSLDLQYVDESLSSFEAHERMEGIHKDKRAKALGVKDSLSAQLILERWMEGIKN